MEPLLRPPFEWRSVVLLLLLAVAILAEPQLFFLSELSGYCVVFGLLALCVRRSVTGFRVVWYKHRLRHNSTWYLQTKDIPQRVGRLYLGKGFRWTQKHAQRLHDTQSDRAQRFIHNVHPFSKLLSGKRHHKKENSAELSASGKPELHGVEMSEQDVWMNLADRAGHSLVLGTTRVGKTRLAELLISQDIQRGEVVIVFDPKGDLELLKRMYAEARRNGREHAFRVFHLGFPEISSRYNAIGRFSRITEVATRIANQLPDGGNSAAFKEFAWRFVNIIARAVVELNHTPNYQLIRRYINDIEPLFIEYARHFLHRQATAGWSREIKHRVENFNARTIPSGLRGRDPEAVVLLLYIQELDIYDPVMDGLVSAYKYDRTYFDKIVSSVGPLMEKLTTGPIAELISPDVCADDPSRPIFEWLDVIQTGGIVYVGLDSLTDTAVASAVGNSMFADLVSVAGHIYKHGVEPDSPNTPKIALHADEFNELIGDEFVPLLNKAGGAGFQVTAYTQTWSDVEARIGSRAKSGQVAGNFNTLIMLRIQELATAKMLTDQLPRVSVSSLKLVSSASDSTKPDSSIDFESRSSDTLSSQEVPLVSPAELFSLPRGHAFAMLDGGRLWKIRFPLPNSTDPDLPKNVQELAVCMHMDRSQFGQQCVDSKDNQIECSQESDSETCTD